MGVIILGLWWLRVSCFVYLVDTRKEVDATTPGPGEGKDEKEVEKETPPQQPEKPDMPVEDDHTQIADKIKDATGVVAADNQPKEVPETNEDAKPDNSEQEKINEKAEAPADNNKPQESKPQETETTEVKPTEEKATKEESQDPPKESEQVSKEDISEEHKQVTGEIQKEVKVVEEDKPEEGPSSPKGEEEVDLGKYLGVKN